MAAICSGRCGFGDQNAVSGLWRNFDPAFMALVGIFNQIERFADKERDSSIYSGTRIDRVDKRCIIAEPSG
jgi:hypothetical protein